MWRLSMSTLVTNTITGLTTATSVTMPTTTKIGATAIVSASAGSATIIAEGGTNTTNIQQGLAKVWIQATSAGSISTQDSFNVASVADTSAGSLTPSITNDMANDDYSIAFGTSSSHVYHQALGTGSFQYTCANSGNTASDSANACATINGDLA